MACATFSEVIGAEPSSTITRHCPPAGCETAIWVRFAFGFFIRKNGLASTGIRSSGVLTRSPLGPCSVILGGAPAPWAATTVPGRPGGSATVCSETEAAFAVRRIVSRYGPSEQPEKYGVRE